jgi:hypothetical protein
LDLLRLRMLKQLCGVPNMDPIGQFDGQLSGLNDAHVTDSKAAEQRYERKPLTHKPISINSGWKIGTDALYSTAYRTPCVGRAKTRSTEQTGHVRHNQ